MTLERQDDIYFDNCIVSTEYDNSEGTYTITFDDGNISLYDVHTMKPFNIEKDPNVVKNLAQAGFYYPQRAPGA